MKHINGFLIAENKKEARKILDIRKSEMFIDSMGFTRIHPSSWVEMVMAHFFLKHIKEKV